MVRVEFAYFGTLGIGCMEVDWARIYRDRNANDSGLGVLSNLSCGNPNPEPRTTPVCVFLSLFLTPCPKGMQTQP